MYNIDKTANELRKRFDIQSTFDLTLKNGANLLLVQDSEGVTVYIGCELVIGDASIRIAAGAICDLATKSKKELYNEFGRGYMITESSEDFSPSAPWNAPGMRVSDFV